MEVDMALWARNVPGTSGEKPYDICGCDSWIDHWQRHSGSARQTCMANGCDRPPQVGAHVQLYGRRTVYIIGLCRGCNHPSNDDYFEVDERTGLPGFVEAKYQTGCGILEDLEEGDVVVKERDSQHWLALGLDTDEVQTVILKARYARYAPR